MEDIQRTKGSRAAYRSHVTRTFRKIDEIMEKEDPLPDPQVAKLTSMLEQLTQKKEVLQQLNTQVAAAIQTPEELEAEILEAEEIQDTILEYMSLIKHRLKPKSTSVEPTRTLHATAPEFVPTYTSAMTDTLPTTTRREPVNRLPKLTLPIFSGDPLMWQTFRDSFDSAIHNCPTLSKVQKFNYLKAQLQGDASRAIAGLPLTEANYDHAIALLTQRYGQAHKIVQAHMQALLEINTPTNTLASLQLYYDTIESHIRGLAALGKTEESYSTMLVPIILGKLPSDIRRNLARDHGNAEWTILQVKEAILKEISILECGLPPSKGDVFDIYKSPMTTTLHAGTSGRQPQPPHQGNNKNTCVFCKGLHFSARCDVVRDAQQRLDIVKKGRHCFNCLGHHRVSQCPSKLRCKTCRQKHHTSLCGAEFSKPTEAAATPPVAAQTMTLQANKTRTTETNKTSTTETPATNPTTVAATIIPPKSVTKLPANPTCLLKTAIAQVSANGLQAEANILFDEGAQRSFMSEKLAKTLRISPQATEGIKLSTFGAELSSTSHLGVATVNVEALTGEQIPISILIVPVIAAPLHNAYHHHLRHMSYLQGLKLANPVTRSGNFEISLLIGADYYWQFVGDHIVRGEGPTAMQSKLGYLLSGPLATPISSQVHANMLHIASTTTKGDTTTEFWSVESTGVSQQSKESEMDFLKQYQRSCIKRDSDGAYCVKFPWKQNHPPLPSNYIICKNITHSLIRRLSQDPELLRMYGKIIIEQEDKGFIEKVTDPKTNKNVHYIPHHPVRKASSTTPIRIVYNCSCRQSTQPSLNDCLETGPSFLTDLCGILLRFRLYAFGISTDLEKAFLHVRLDEGDRDYTRFLWLSTPSDSHSELATYRFKTVLFGSTSSPFMLSATLYCHLNFYNTPTAHDMKRNLYVDNIISGCNTEEQAIEYYKEARSIMNQAKFNLRSWASNSHQLQSLAKSEGTVDKDTTVSLLGLLWSTSTDTITFPPKQFLVSTEEQPVTKRIVLQVASKIYDPLGFLTPITIQAKILMQQLWQSGIDWDEPIHRDHQKTWFQIAKDLQDTVDIKIPRCYFTPPSKQPTELHVFSDASMKAYGAVAFLRAGDRTSFVLARSRVVPLKGHTLPRLELMGAVMASRLAKFICTALQHTSLQNISVMLWCDSQIVLYWLQSQKRLKQFVSNRVQEINNTFPNIPWHYCPTDDNPADLLTRGLTTVQLVSSQLWLHGPRWLVDETQRPVWKHSEILHLQVDECDTEDPVRDIQPTHDKLTSDIQNIIQASNYSTLSRLLHVTSYLLRFIHNTRHSTSRKTGPVSTDEISTALSLWIYSCQHNSFTEEIHSLQSNAKKQLPLVRQLRLFLDSSGYVRCGGRIHNAPISEDTKFPYLLPKSHHLTKLIVYAVHECQLHAGVNSTVTSLRQQYWIPAARQLVRSLLRKCVPCRKTTGKAYPIPESPPLPKDRIKEGKPFEITGVDFTGTLYVKDHGSESKAYICLFTCGLSRAVHLEVVQDLSVETFLQAFRRFAARKSLPRVLLSDNASTYVSAAKELQQLFTSHKLEESLTSKGVQWKFIPKRAPWYGGFWERLIGLTKNVLKKVLGRSFITFETLQTLAVEIEAVLNDRPLTYLPTDIDDPHPLTPSHLLYGRRITSLPHNVVEEDEITDPTFLTNHALQERTKRQTQILQHFQQRWKSEYLTSLRDTHKGTHTSKQTIKIGDIVIVHDDVPRSRWKLAVIEELIEGLDGYTRAAKIRTANGTTNRPVAKLFPLEVSAACEMETNATKGNEDNDDQDEPPAACERVTRNAAIRARDRIKNWSNMLSVAPEDVTDSD